MCVVVLHAGTLFSCALAPLEKISGFGFRIFTRRFGWAMMRRRAGAPLAVPPNRVRLLTLCVLALHAVALFDPVSQLGVESPLEASYPLVGRSLAEGEAWNSEAAELAGYPVDRSECDTRDIPCMAGTRRLANEFELMMTVEPIITLKAEGMEILLDALANRKRRFVPPEGTIIDYTGGYNLLPAPYEAPQRY